MKTSNKGGEGNIIFGLLTHHWGEGAVGGMKKGAGMRNPFLVVAELGPDFVSGWSGKYSGKIQQ